MYSSSPAVFKSSKPLWCDLNAREIATSTKSTCIFGHVRAAAMGGIVSEQNCHPFKYGILMMQHNGHIQDFHLIKRDMISMISEPLFQSINGTTDSEYFFCLLLTNLSRCDKISYEATELSDALEKTIKDVICLLKRRNIDNGFTTFNISLTDGKNLVISRFCDKPGIPPPSLYYTLVKGSSFVELINNRNHNSELGGPGDGSSKDGSSKGTSRRDILQKTHQASIRTNFTVDVSSDCAFIVSSEPLLENSDTWIPIKENSILVYNSEQKKIFGRVINHISDMWVNAEQ